MLFQFVLLRLYNTSALKCFWNNEAEIEQTFHIMKPVNQIVMRSLKPLGSGCDYPKFLTGHCFFMLSNSVPQVYNNNIPGNLLLHFYQRNEFRFQIISLFYFW